MPKSKTNNKRTLLLVLVPLVLILIALGLIYRSHHNHKAVSGTIPSKNPLQTQQNTPTDKTPSSTSSSSSQNTNTSTPSPANSSLVAPSGTFVSNHRPSLSGANGVPSSEQSVCNTTPGASCYITFTSNGVTKALSTQTANSNGVVIWNWDVKQAGFTEGAWKITAIATLDGSTKSTTDSLTLEVQQ